MSPSHSFGCHHWRQAVQVGRFTITCSAGAAGGRNKPPYPDFGIYLAPEWKVIVGDELLTNGAAIKKVRELGLYPAVFVDWADMSAPKPEFLARLVDICLAKMRAGKRIDIGCSAGHGRSGSLLAALIARVEHLDGRRAVKAARDRYCRCAVETPRQESAVEIYAKHWRSYR